MKPFIFSRLSLYLLFLFGATFVAKAQTQRSDSTLHQSMVVEQDYQSEISDAAKLNALPKPIPVTIQKQRIRYIFSSTLPSQWEAAPLLSSYKNPISMEKSLKNYLRLGYGGMGRVDGALFLKGALSPDSEISLTATLAGIDGSFEQEEGSAYDMHYYRTRVGLDYLKHAATLDWGMDAWIGVDNYTFAYDGAAANLALTTQSTPQVTLHSFVRSQREQVKLKAGISYSYFGIDDLPALALKGYKEQQLTFDGEMESSFSATHKVGVRVKANRTFYSIAQAEAHTYLSVSPYYSFAKEKWDIRLGINVALQNADKVRYHVAPNLYLAYHWMDTGLLYLSATGDVQLTDRRYLQTRYPYLSTEQISNKSSFQPLDLQLGVRAFFSGFWGNLYGGYEYIINDIYLPVTTATLQTIEQHDTKRTVFGAALKYQMKDRISCELSAKVYGWSTPLPAAYYLLKASSQLKATLTYRPVQPLELSAVYTYTGREKTAHFIDDFSCFNVKAVYSIHPKFSIYADVNNLLNEKSYAFPNYPMPTFSILGGIRVVF
ncbi:MAG: hypothetical protein WCQ82_01380 [Bacteroidaceae bacterium]|nr:TonB-dependent receptor [Bacteroidaceae bacterium]